MINQFEEDKLVEYNVNKGKITMIPNLETIGRWIVILGLAITIIGGGIWLIAKITGWEKFPGTIKWQSGNLTCLVPLLGSIILSILLTLVLNLLARWFNR